MEAGPLCVEPIVPDIRSDVPIHGVEGFQTTISQPRWPVRDSHCTRQGISTTEADSQIGRDRCPRPSGRGPRTSRQMPSTIRQRTPPAETATMEQWTGSRAGRARGLDPWAAHPDWWYRYARLPCFDFRLSGHVPRPGSRSPRPPNSRASERQRRSSYGSLDAKNVAFSFRSPPTTPYVEKVAFPPEIELVSSLPVCDVATTLMGALP